jgi:hypothetical protein
MKTVLQECLNLLKCKNNQLDYKISHPESREKLLKHLIGRRVQTTYEDRNGFKKIFTIGGLSRQGADSIYAYGKLSRTFNVTVSQHFFSRHNIRLKNPYLPCIIEKHGPNSEDRYYPLELLKFIDEEDQCRCADIFELFQLQIEEEEIDEDSQCSFCSFCSHYH